MRVCQMCEYHVSIACLRFVESLVYYEIYMYLQLKGDKETVNVDNVKSRDLELMNNQLILEECGMKEVVHLLSEEAIGVLKRDFQESKMNMKRDSQESKASNMKNTISYLIRISVVYAKERESKLSTLVEVFV